MTLKNCAIFDTFVLSNHLIGSLKNALGYFLNTSNFLNLAKYVRHVIQVPNKYFAEKENAIEKACDFCIIV